VGAGDKVLVLTDEHAFPDQIDADETAHELTEAESALKVWSGELDAEHQELLDQAEWAQAKLEVKKH